jgi:hypothetical protein
MAGKNDCGMEGKGWRELMAGRGWRETGGGNIWREGVGGKRVAGTYGGNI